MDWIDEMTTALGPGLELPPDVRDEILDLARIASHTSGDRINAPLLCYALGIAVGRGASLAELSVVVREAAGQV